ncbi:MAG: hypothetical protein ACERKV_05350 [Clostridiaceae bacterium]
MDKKDKGKKNKKKRKSRWIAKIIFWTILLSGSFTIFSDMLLRKVNILVAFVILTMVIFIGIMFDLVGVAVTSATITPFNAMASKKIKGAKTAINLIKNAAKVSSFCNDVIGDISGILSGTIGVIIAQKIISQLGTDTATIVKIIIAVLIGTVTIAGKAIGKSIAIENSNEITYKFARIIFFIKRGR